MRVPTATFEDAVTEQLEPAVEVVVQLMIEEPLVHVVELVEGVTVFNDHVVAAPL